MKSVTLNDIVVFHREILKRYGGCPGHEDTTRLESILGRVQSHIEYGQITDTLEIASLYCVSLARGHAFTDANKRIAVGVMILFLKRNRVNVTHESDLADTIVDIASGDLSQAKLSNYLKTIVISDTTGIEKWNPVGFHPLTEAVD